MPKKQKRSKENGFKLGKIAPGLWVSPSAPSNCIDVTSANPKGAADERAVLQQTLEPDRCYLTDRGYAKFVLWNQVNAIGSSYVCRIRDTRRDSHPQGHYQRFKMQYSSHVIFPLPQASWRNPLLLALKGSVFNLKEMITFQKHTVELNVLEGLRCFKLTTTRGVLQTCPASIQHSLRIPIAQ